MEDISDHENGLDTDEEMREGYVHIDPTTTTFAENNEDNKLDISGEDNSSPNKQKEKEDPNLMSEKNEEVNEHLIIEELSKS